MNLKERLIKLFKGNSLNDDKKDNETITLTKTELDNLINSKANELLEQELNSLDKSFIEQINKSLLPSNNSTSTKSLNELSKDEQVKAILKGETTNE